MQAVLRVNTFNPDTLAESPRQLEEFDEIHRAQEGYLGGVTVDLGEGRRFVLNLWASDEHRQAGLSALAPEVERLVNPVLTKPSELIGVGPVVGCDLVRLRDA